HRLRRARREDLRGRAGPRRLAARDRRPLRGPLPLDLGRARPRLLALHPHHRPRPRAPRAGGPGADPPRGARRLPRVRGRLLRRLRALPHRARPRRRPLPRPRPRAREAPRGELLLPDERALRLARGLDPRAPGLRPPGVVPRRGARDAPRGVGPRRPVHLAPEGATAVGDRAPLRPRLRLLRVVRRADQLPHRDWLPRRPGLRRHLARTDILKPPRIFWPIMLRALGLAPARRLAVHGYWQVDDRKVSKSLGNMVSPLAMRDRYGFEPFRYYLLREMSFGHDASFGE